MVERRRRLRHVRTGRAWLGRPDRRRRAPHAAKREACVPEARPLRTRTELWEAHPKGTRTGREAGVLNRSAGPVRTQTAAWDAGPPAFYWVICCELWHSAAPAARLRVR